jgi:hypothetical protein
MPADTARPTHVTLPLTEEERAGLLDLLQQALGEARVEVHRTHTPAFRDQVLRQEALIRGVIERLGRLGA